jgi:hypothetical protein
VYAKFPISFSHLDKHMTNWLVVSTPLKNMKVSWDDDIPNIWKVIKFMFQTTNQQKIRLGWTHLQSQAPPPAIPGSQGPQPPQARWVTADPWAPALHWATPWWWKRQRRRRPQVGTLGALSFAIEIYTMYVNIYDDVICYTYLCIHTCIYI